jgi:hypothetical protein
MANQAAQNPTSTWHIRYFCARVNLGGAPGVQPRRGGPGPWPARCRAACASSAGSRTTASSCSYVWMLTVPVQASSASSPATTSRALKRSYADGTCAEDLAVPWAGAPAGSHRASARRQSWAEFPPRTFPRQLLLMIMKRASSWCANRWLLM